MVGRVTWLEGQMAYSAIWHTRQLGASPLRCIPI